MKKILLSLVVLVSILFSFQGFSQTPGTLTFSDSLGVLHGYDPITDLGDYDTLVSDVNAGDTLFYMDFVFGNTYKYYGIIENVSNDSVVLKLQLETEKVFYSGDIVVDTTNGTNSGDITGTSITATYPMNRHFVKDMSIATNTKLNFDVLHINSSPIVPFKFSFTFTYTDPSTGFEDNFFTEKETFKVYPNPCENQLNIEADGLKRIFDMNGRLMLETYENTVNMSDLAPGMYVVMLESGATKKISKKE